MATVFTTQSRSYTTVYNRPFSIITTSRWQRSKLWFSLTISILGGAGKYILFQFHIATEKEWKRGEKNAAVRAGCNWEQAPFPQILQKVCSRYSRWRSEFREIPRDFRGWLWTFPKRCGFHMQSNCSTPSSPPRGGEGRCQAPGLFQALFILA